MAPPAITRYAFFAIALLALDALTRLYAEPLSKVFQVLGNVPRLLDGDTDAVLSLTEGALRLLKKHGQPAPQAQQPPDGYQYKPIPGSSIIFERGQEWTVGNQNVGFHKIDFQASDGNFVIYDSNNRVVWTANTGGLGATFMAMQEDGNLVIYSGKVPLWQSGTAGNNGAWLGLNWDGNVVVYLADRPLIGAFGTAKTLPTLSRP